MGFWSAFRDVLDDVFAPSSAFDSHSDVHDSSFSADTEREVAWHNDFGTAADYQVPAESSYDHSNGNDW